MKTNPDTSQYTLNDYKLDIVRIKLVTDRTIFSNKPISSPEAAIEFFGKEIADWDRETILIFNLDNKNNVINVHVASLGTVNYSATSMRELIKSSVLSNASSMIIMHNHPSGDTTPSSEDINLTGTLVSVGKLMGIEVLDHIIVGSVPEYHYYSFFENAMLTPSNKINIIDDTKKMTMAAEKKTRRKTR